MKSKWTEIICCDCGIHFAVEQTFAHPRVVANQAIAQGGEKETFDSQNLDIAKSLAELRQGPETIHCPNGCEVAPIKVSPMFAQEKRILDLADEGIAAAKKYVVTLQDSYDAKERECESLRDRLQRTEEYWRNAQDGNHRRDRQIAGFKGVIARQKKQIAGHRATNSHLHETIRQLKVKKN